MLSTENPPPDPLYSSETSQLKSGSCCNNVCGDERALSGGGHPQLEVVDLSKSGLNLNDNSLHFSIRDYVFNSRGKNIANHWPFSPQNLHFCLKHGVNGVLPPFDVVRTSSLKPVAENVINNSDVKPSQFGDHHLCGSNNVVQKLTLDVENIQSNVPEEDKENQSSASATQSSSCVKSDSVIDISCLQAEEVENLSQSLAEKPEISVIPASYEVEISSQALVKKCRSIVKLSSIGKAKPNEEVSGNTSVVSETMASKVCPVCKTFSSSSNTTLNAHIDQCLSGDPPVKWTTNSKTNKHRVKPKKTRLVVDIYATALPCTLEHLDRRNGTNWASNLDILVQDGDQIPAEEKNGSSCVNGEVKNDEGTVYFDANGKKVCMLSKFGDRQSNLNGNDFIPWKLVKKDKGSKCVMIKKKNDHTNGQKRAKWPSRERSCSPKPPDNHPKDVSAMEMKFLPEEDEEKMSQSHPLNARDQLVSNDFGKKKHWVGSKRTVPKQKNNRKCEKHVVKIAKDLGPNRQSASVSDEFIKRSHDSNFKRKENLSFHFSDEYSKEPYLRRREGFSSSSSQDCLGKRGHPVLSKWDVQSRKDCPPIHKRSLHGAESHASSWSSKKMKTASLTGNGYSSFIKSRISCRDTISPECEKFGRLMKTASNYESLSGCKKSTSLRKNALSVEHAPPRSQLKKSGTKMLAFRKHQAPCVSRSYDEAFASVPAAHRHDWVEVPGKSATPKLSIDRAMVLKNRKGRRRSANTIKESNMGSTGSDTPHECDTYEAEKIGSCLAVDIPADKSNVPDAVKVTDVPDGFVCEPISKLSSCQEGCSAFGDSFDSEFPGLGALSGDKPSSQNYVEDYEECCVDGLMSLGKQENCCPDKVGKGVVTSYTLLEDDGNASEAQRSYCAGVDPIPIPGPPGSFLPSPERMGSEELQGNSSLTTCRVLSFEEEHELAHMDTSDSSVSATSFVFNPVAARSEQSQGVPNDSQHDASEERMDPIVESPISSERAGGQNEKQQINEEQANMVPEMSPKRFRNNQPCCSCRKEGAIRNCSLNDHELEPPRSQAMTMTFLPPLPSGGCDRTDIPYISSTLRVETPPQMQRRQETEKAGANSPKACAPTTTHNSEAKFPTYGDCESPSPSPSTSSSVLRLMGKNLMVVNYEENQSTQVRHMQSSILDNHQSLESSVVGQLNMSSQEGPSTFGNMQTYKVPLPHYVDLSSLDRSISPSKFRSWESYLYPSRVMFSSKSFGSNLKCCEYADRCNLTTVDTTYEAKKVQTPIPEMLLPNATTTWNRNLGGSSAFCQDSATVSSGHYLKPSLYVSPSFPSPN